jgi:neuronal guanine nucleotide exchange factor
MTPSLTSPQPASSNATTPTDPIPPEKISRKKSKTGKSFKSKFRKSVTPDSSLNLGSSFNGTRSTFYVSDSMDVDSGIFTSEKQTSIEDMNGGSSTATTPTTSNLNNSTVAESGVVAPERRRSKQTPDLTKRKSSLGVRPNNPPPPPPPPVAHTEKKLLKSKRNGTTSWYAECGVFKSDTLKNEGFCADGKRGDRNVSNPNSCWYSEAGLYQTSGVSEARLVEHYKRLYL